MANKFDSNRWIKHGQEKPRATAGRIVMEWFHKQSAYDENSAIAIQDFKDVPLSNEVIAYTLANFYEGDLVGITSDEKYYFCKDNYKKFERKTIFQFYMVLAIPVIILLIMLLIINGGKLSFLMK